MTGVLLINMGGPESPLEVKKFLRLMFLDKHIIPAPYIIRNLLSFYISSTRYKKSWSRYQIIGGTPIKKDTDKLVIITQNTLGTSFKVKAAYSYSEPFISTAISEFNNENIKNIIAIPLYPQASITTTESVAFDIEKIKNNFPQIKIKVAKEFFTNKYFIEFWNNIISFHNKENNLTNPLLLFSAHSIPVSFIKKGDTYQKGIEESAKLIANSLGLEYKVSYQSGMNPKTWLGPDTITTIKELALKDKNEIVIIPISFVSENLETLYDLDNQIIPTIKNEIKINISRVKIPAIHTSFTEMIKNIVYELKY
ncbi:MAG: ferrochelatase [Bacteroidia bacterium]|nr:ferrochelatase [Bacteroidia bacterium]